MTIQRETIRTALVRFAKSNATDVRQYQELRESRAGTYNTAVEAAVAAGGNAKAFEEVFEEVFEDIRQDRGGIAVELGCAIAARKGDNGEPVYRIPSGMSAAKSILTRALERKVALQDDDGAPRAYNAIRSDVLELARREARRKDDPTKQRRRLTMDVLAEMRTRTKGLDAEQLAELHDRLAEAWQAVAGSPIKVNAKRRQVTKVTASGRRSKARRAA